MAAKGSPLTFRLSVEDEQKLRAIAKQKQTTITQVIKHSLFGKDENSTAA